MDFYVDHNVLSDSKSYIGEHNITEKYKSTQFTYRIIRV